MDHTLAWDRYQRGISHLRMFGTITDTEQAYRFFNGDQWYGVQAGDTSLPVFNVIKPIVQYKVSVVGQNSMEMVYRPQDAVDEEYGDISATCTALNKMASNTWERLKMDRRRWDDIRDAAIVGDKCRYFYWDEENEWIEGEEVERSNIFFGDEQGHDLQAQPYIIIAQRRPVSRVKEEAHRMGASKEDVEKIVADHDLANQISPQARVEIQDNEHGKCTTIICFERIEGKMRVTRSTRDVEYSCVEIEGMKLYPIVSLVWNRVKGSARGLGEVKPIIANQIEINKTLYRNTQAVKIYSLPRIVYNENLENPEDIEAVGVPLRVSGNNVQRIHEIVDYLRPQTLSSDTRSLLDTYMAVTKDLAGASDAAIGNINPEQASGTAILAVKRSSEMPISDSIEAYKQYVEDIALVWFDLWRTYAVNGLDVVIDDAEIVPGGTAAQVIIPPRELLANVSVRIEVSPTNPYDKYAQELSLQNLLSGGYISFEEYVESLPDDAVMPKAKLKKILEMREAQAQKQPPPAPPGMPTMAQGGPTMNPMPQGMV